MQFSGRPYCLGSALYAQGKLKVQIKVICVTNCLFWVKLVRDNSGSNPPQFENEFTAGNSN